MLPLEKKHINLARLYINVVEIPARTKQYYVIATDGGLSALTSEKQKQNSNRLI